MVMMIRSIESRKEKKERNSNGFGNESFFSFKKNLLSASAKQLNNLDSFTVMVVVGGRREFSPLARLQAKNNEKNLTATGKKRRMNE